MPSWQPMTSGSSECHTEVPFFYSPASVHMGAPDCKVLWINDLSVRLRNKSPHSHGAQAPAGDKQPRRQLVQDVIDCAGQRDKVHFLESPQLPRWSWRREGRVGASPLPLFFTTCWRYVLWPDVEAWYINWQWFMVLAAKCMCTVTYVQIFAWVWYYFSSILGFHDIVFLFKLTKMTNHSPHGSHII